MLGYEERKGVLGTCFFSSPLRTAWELERKSANVLCFLGFDVVFDGVLLFFLECFLVMFVMFGY